MNSILDLFDSKRILESTIFEFQNTTEDILNPTALVTNGKLLVALNLKTNFLFSGIDTKNERLINNWGDIGQGPCELIGVLDFYKNYLNNGVNAWDPISKKLMFYSFDSIPDGKYLSTCRNLLDINFNKDLMNMFYPKMIQLDESLFFALGNSKGKRFTLFDISNNQVVSIGEYPDKDNNEHIVEYIRTQAYNGNIRYNNKIRKIAYISSNSELFEIYSIENNLINLEYRNQTTIPNYSQEDMSLELNKTEGSVGRNNCLTISNDKIFILYQEYSFIVDKNKNLNEANIILVFDWNGNPIQMYQLDCAVTYIEFDEINNRIYAIRDNPDPQIIYFDL